MRTIVTIFAFVSYYSLSFYYIILSLFLAQLIHLFLMIRTPIAARFAASLIQKEWGLSDDYEIMSMLGKGSSARVFMGANVISG